MQLIQRFLFVCLLPLSLTLAVGCGDSSQPEAVADGDDIEAFLAANPDMAVDAEEEAALMEGDAAVED